MSVLRCRDMVEQVLFGILLNLPVMSLLRFKVACKYWFSLINSYAFISEHFKHNCDNKEDNFIILGSVPHLRRPKAEFALLSCSQYEERVYDIDFSQCWRTASSATLTGYCDGIICIAWGADIAVWNPALRQLRPIPRPLSLSRKSELQELKCSMFFYAFGLDVKNNDYKLVHIWYHFGNTCDDIIGNQVEVHSLRGDDFWRIINEDDVLPFVEILTYNAISSAKSGKCFWVARCYDNTTILLSFDFTHDVFRTKLLPDENLSSRYFDLDLLDDKIVYIVDKSDDYGKSFNIWLLDAFHVEKSWNLVYKVGPFYYLDSFNSPRISNNGEFLICRKSDITLKDDEIEAMGWHKLYIYNIHTQQGKFVRNCNLEIYGGGLIHYSESLFSLKRKNTIMIT